MNWSKKHLLPFLILLCLCITFSVHVEAQDPDPPPNPWENCVPDPFEECPIDGGIGLLIAAGVALGARNRATHKK